MATTHIRVADAPLNFAPNPEAAEGTHETVPAVATGGLFRWALIGLLVLELSCFMAVFGPRQSVPVKALVLARYSLWPCCAIVVGYHLSRRGTGPFYRAAAFVLPFFAIGVVAGVLGYDLVGSAKELIFWGLGISAVIAIAYELPTKTVWRTLFWTFAVVVGISAALAVLKPAFGTVPDNRAFNGVAWRGVFVGKNQLGDAAAYLVIVSAFAFGVPRLLRIGAGVLAAGTLVFASSQGSIVTALAVIGVTIVITLLRRTRSSPGVQALLFGSGSVALMLFTVFGLGFVLEALGRDPTLTGRTDIWAAYFSRATLFWLTGAGPGTFEEISGVTYDVTASLLKYGPIANPHNIYIAVFGETGIFGFAAFVLAVGSCAFVLPFADQRRGSLAVGAAACAMLFGGLVETHEVFGTGLGMTILVLLRTLVIAGDAMPAAAPAAPDRPASTGIAVLG